MTGSSWNDLYEDDFECELIPFQLSASAGIGDLNIVWDGGGPFANVVAENIKAGMLVLVRTTANDGTAATHASMSCGMFARQSDSEFQQWYYSARTESGPTTTDTKNSQDDDQIIGLIDPSSSDFEVAGAFTGVVDGSDGPGIVVDITEIDSGSDYWGFVLLFAGSTIEAEAGVASQSTGATYTTGFQSNLIIFGGARTGGAAAWDGGVDNDARMSIGFVAPQVDGTIDSYGINWASNNAKANVEQGIIGDVESFMYGMYPGFGALTSHYVSAISSTGFTTSIRDGTGDNSYGWLAMNVPGYVFEMNVFNYSSTSGDFDNVTFPGSAEKFAIFLPSEITTWNGKLGTGDDADPFGIGVATRQGHACFAAIYDNDGSGNGAGRSVFHEGRICSYQNPAGANPRNMWFDGFLRNDRKNATTGGYKWFKEDSDTASRDFFAIVATRHDAEPIETLAEVQDETTNPISFLDHAEGGAVNGDFFASTTGGGGAFAVTDGYYDIDWAGSVSEQSWIHTKFPLDTSRSFMFAMMVRVADAQSYPMIGIFDDAVIASGGRDTDLNQAFRTGVGFDGVGAEFIYDLVGNTAQNFTYWHGEEAASNSVWDSAQDYAIEDIDVGVSDDWHLIVFDFDGINQRFRWLGTHRSGRTAMTDRDQGSRLVAISDWVDLSSFDQNADWNDVHLIIGDPNQDSNQGQIHVEYILYESASASEIIHGYTNAKASASSTDNYKIRHNLSNQTQFFPEGRGVAEINSGSVGSWNEFGHRKKKITQIADGSFVMMVEGFDSALTDTSLGIFTASDAAGPWTAYSGNPIIVPSDIGSEYDQVSAPWPEYDTANSRWIMFVTCQSTDADLTHRSFLMESDGDLDGTWTVVTGPYTDGAMFEESGIFNWRHNGVGDVTILPDQGDGTVRALVSGFHGGFGWKVGYAEGPDYESLVIDEYLGPLAGAVDAIQSFSAVSGKTVTVSDGSAYDVDAIVIIRNDTTNDDWHVSRIRKISGNDLELYHEVGGLLTTDTDRRVAQINAGSMTPHSFQVLPGGGYRIYLTCFQPFILATGAIGNMETCGSIIAPDLKEPSSWYFDHIRSPHALMDIWDGETNNENLNFHFTQLAALTENFTESVEATETATFGYGKNLDEAIQATEGMVTGQGKAMTESVEAAESISIDRSLVFDEAVQVTESTSRGYSLGLTESVQVAESGPIKAYGVVLSESVLVTETTAKAYAFNLDESVEVGESESFPGTENFDESIEVTETVVKVYGKVLDEGAQATETIDKAVGKVADEGVEVTETIVKAYAIVFTETIHVTESQNTVLTPGGGGPGPVNFVREFSATVLSSETIEKAYGLVLDESATVSESDLRSGLQFNEAVEVSETIQVEQVSANVVPVVLRGRSSATKLVGSGSSVSLGGRSASVELKGRSS